MWRGGLFISIITKGVRAGEIRTGGCSGRDRGQLDRVGHGGARGFGMTIENVVEWARIVEETRPRKEGL